MTRFGYVARQIWFVPIQVISLSLPILTPLPIYTTYIVYGCLIFYAAVRLVMIGLYPGIHKTTAVDVYDTDPLKAWKCARVRSLETTQPFRALHARRDYNTKDKAVCTQWAPNTPAQAASDSMIPHDLDSYHHCGFYAYMKKRNAIKLWRRQKSCAFLEVELYGTVLEGMSSSHFSGHLVSFQRS